MAKRMCLLTGYETDCKDDCFNCNCGGKEATKDMYVSINNVQRVCSITGGAADTNEGKYLSEVIRNNLERMIDADVQPVKHAHWYATSSYDPPEWCSNCDVRTRWAFDEGYCPNCGAKMDGGADNENS